MSKIYFAGNRIPVQELTIWNLWKALCFVNKDTMRDKTFKHSFTKEPLNLHSVIDFTEDVDKSHLEVNHLTYKNTFLRVPFFQCLISGNSASNKGVVYEITESSNLGLSKAIESLTPYYGSNAKLENFSIALPNKESLTGQLTDEDIDLLLSLMDSVEEFVLNLVGVKFTAVVLDLQGMRTESRLSLFSLLVDEFLNSGTMSSSIAQWKPYYKIGMELIYGCDLTKFKHKKYHLNFQIGTFNRTKVEYVVKLDVDKSDIKRVCDEVQKESKGRSVKLLYAVPVEDFKKVPVTRIKTAITELFDKIFSSPLRKLIRPISVTELIPIPEDNSEVKKLLSTISFSKDTYESYKDSCDAYTSLGNAFSLLNVNNLQKLCYILLNLDKDFLLMNKTLIDISKLKFDNLQLFKYNVISFNFRLGTRKAEIYGLEKVIDYINHQYSLTEPQISKIDFILESLMFWKSEVQFRISLDYNYSTPITQLTSMSNVFSQSINLEILKKDSSRVNLLFLRIVESCVDGINKSDNSINTEKAKENISSDPLH